MDMNRALKNWLKGGNNDKWDGLELVGCWEGLEESAFVERRFRGRKMLHVLHEDVCAFEHSFGWYVSSVLRLT